MTGMQSGSFPGPGTPLPPLLPHHLQPRSPSVTLMQVSADTAQLQLRMCLPRSHEFVLKYLKFLTVVIKTVLFNDL